MDKFVTKGDLFVLSDGLGDFSHLSLRKKSLDTKLSYNDHLERSKSVEIKGVYSKSSSDLKVFAPNILENSFDVKKKYFKDMLVAHFIDLLVILLTFTIMVVGVEYLFFEGAPSLGKVYYLVFSFVRYPLFIPVFFIVLYAFYFIYRFLFVRISKKTIGEMFYNL
jgi:hypothetical protein